MIKRILFVLINCFILVNLACTKTETPNSNTNQAVVTNVNTASLPEGLSTSPIAPTGEAIPGIPDPKSVNANSNSKTAGSTPGIPDTTKMGTTPNPTKTPRIPGIPDEETLKKQMTTTVDKSVMDRKPSDTEANSAARPNNKQPNKPNSNSNQQ